MRRKYWWMDEEARVDGINSWIRACNIEREGDSHIAWQGGISIWISHSKVRFIIDVA